MGTSYRARILLAMLKLFSGLVKACAIIIVSVVLFFAGFPLLVTIGLYVTGYSDGALYSAAKKCVDNTIGVDKVRQAKLDTTSEMKGVHSD